MRDVPCWWSSLIIPFQAERWPAIPCKLFLNVPTISVFVGPVSTFVPCRCCYFLPVSIMENVFYIQLYICEYTVFFTVLQPFLGSLSTFFVNVLHWGSPSTPRSPAFSRGFVYTFGGELKGGGALHVGVRPLHFLFHLL
jgi:hypothetical protein